MDAISLLKQDHAVVKRLFDDFEELGGGAGAGKRQVADRIIRELSIHTAIEEQFLYPYVKQRDERLGKLVYEALEEHNVAKWELSSLERLDPRDPRFDAKMSVLMESVRHHIREEEETLLPGLARVCERAELEALGDTLRHAKDMAPTHPHPRAPDQPPGNAMAPVLAAMDRGRDLAADFAEETLKRSRKLVESTLERGRKLVRGQARKLEALRRDARTFSRKAGKQTARAAREVVQAAEQTRRKTVARATAAKRRTAKSSRSKKRR